MEKLAAIKIISARKSLLAYLGNIEPITVLSSAIPRKPADSELSYGFHLQSPEPAKTATKAVHIKSRRQS